MNKRIKKKLQKRYWCKHYREYKAVKRFLSSPSEFDKLNHVINTAIDERIVELSERFSNYLTSKGLTRHLLSMKPGECPCDPDMGVDVGQLSHCIDSSNVRKAKIIERIHDRHFPQENDEDEKPVNDFDVTIQRKPIRK